MDSVMLEVVDGSALQVLQVPLQAADITSLLRTALHRVTMYIADPQLQTVPGDKIAQFRDLKVDDTAVPFILCTVCRAVLPVVSVSSEEVVTNHQCNNTQSSEPLPQDETYVDEFLTRRMNKVSGPANSLYIQEEVRSCFSLCRWADVLLVCPQDQFKIRVHGLILAAASPVLASVLTSLPVLDQEEMTILLPDYTRDELIPFLSHLYGQTLDNTDFSSALFHLVDFDFRPVIQEHKLPEVKLEMLKKEIVKIVPDQDLYGDINDSDLIEQGGEGEMVGNEEDFKTKDIERILAEEPGRIQLVEVVGPGRTTKVWGGYFQVIVDGRSVNFLKCRDCDGVFLQTKTSSTTAIKKHSRTHVSSQTGPENVTETPQQVLTQAEIKRLMVEESERVTQHENTVAGDIWRHFCLIDIDGETVPWVVCLHCQGLLSYTVSTGIAGLRKHHSQHSEESSSSSSSPHKKKIRLFTEKIEDDTRTGVKKDWDQTFIEDIKNELQAPSQKIKDPVTEQGPGVSKFAISQLIQAGSPRVTFEESTTHSAVWEKFVKIALDTVEVPFVCCKFCRKVYTHDRSLGTSSLIRHTCGEEPEVDRVIRAGGLPRILVQELVNTNSGRISRKEMQAKFNLRLNDVTSIFERVLVDAKETEYVSCRKCNKLYVFSATKTSVMVIKKLELHECYIKYAPCMTSYADPQDEKEYFVIYVREPHRIVLKDKVKSEPNLHYFLLDGNKTDFAHCTKCCKFFPISSLNFNEERIHRCHKVKTADHNIQFKKKVPHQCEKCRAVFKSEHFMEIHMRRDHGEGSATVTCSQCAKEFPTERLAKKHEMHVHYPEISKKFSCKDCDAMFHDRSKLKLHAMKHSNIKPYVCEQCGKGFNWVASFQDHMDMHGGVKKYTCEFCNRHFTKRNTLNNHRRLHTGEKPFMCPSPGCGMTFVQRTACKTHAKKRHNIDITMYTRNPEVPQTPASLAQMSLAQRTEQMVLQERMLESGQEMPLDEEQTVTLVQAASNLSPAQTIQLRGLSQVSSGVGGVPGATLQLTQLPGGQVVHILQPVPNERGENVVTLQGGSQLTQIRLFDPREGATFLDQVGRHNLSQEVAAHRAEERA